jgi:hypothetical protein
MREWTLPVAPDAPAAELGRGRTLAMARKHRIGLAVERNVALNRFAAHGFVASVLAQALELGVHVEHQGRIAEAARGAAGVGMQADDKKPLPPMLRLKCGEAGSESTLGSQ